MTSGTLALELVTAFEGFSATSYRDVAGIWTIGYGTIKLPTGDRVGPGMTLSESLARTYMQHDLRWVEAAINTHLPGCRPQHQFDALVSFVYNVGSGGFAGSTICRKLKAQQPVVEANFTAWNKARVNGVLTPVAGLTRRRKAEWHLFSTGQIRLTF